MRGAAEPSRLFVDSGAWIALRSRRDQHHPAAGHWTGRLAPRPVTYADAVSFAVMEELGCRHALAFDQDFVVAGFELWRPRR